MHGDDFARPSLGRQRVFLRARSDLAALRVELAADRVIRLLNLDRRYREDQPRVPAGNGRISGQWTDGGSGVGGTSDGRVRVAQARGGRGNSPILARFPDATAAQDARWAVSDVWARDAIARAQERIPGYRPQASFQETIEGEINKNEADARDAEAALATAGAQARPPPETLDTVCRPNGESIGWKQKGASANIRTVTSDGFDRLTRDLTNGAQEMPPTDPDYRGIWYRRSDGTTIGVRRSERHGLTIDIIDSLGNANLRRLRIHKK